MKVKDSIYRFVGRYGDIDGQKIKQVNCEFRHENGKNFLRQYEFLIIPPEFDGHNGARIVIKQHIHQDKSFDFKVNFDVTKEGIEQKLEYLYWTAIRFKDVKISTCKNKFEFTNPKTRVTATQPKRSFENETRLSYDY